VALEEFFVSPSNGEQFQPEKSLTIGGLCVIKKILKAVIGKSRYRSGITESRREVRTGISAGTEWAWEPLAESMQVGM